MVGALVVGVACLVLVVRGIEPEGVAAAVASFDPRSVPIAAALYGLGLLARAARFQVLLPTRVSYGRILCVVGASRLATAALPLRAGTIVGPTLLAGRGDAPFGEALAVVAAEHLLDVLSLLGLVAFAAALWASDAPDATLFPALAGAAATGAFAIVALLGLLVALGRVGLALVVRATTRLAPSLAPAVERVLGRFLDSLRLLASRPREGALAALFTLGWWGAAIGAGAVVMQSFVGLPPITPRIAVLHQLAVVGGSALVPSPGHVGGFEAASVAAMVALGADPRVALVFAVVLHATQLGVTAAAGMVCFAIAGWSLRAVTRSEGPGGA